MKATEARFFMETMAILFEQRRNIVTILDDMVMRMEELEVELEQQMIDSGFNVVNNPWRYNNSTWTQEKECSCSSPDNDSYRMD